MSLRAQSISIDHSVCMEELSFHDKERVVVVAHLERYSHVSEASRVTRSRNWYLSQTQERRGEDNGEAGGLQMSQSTSTRFK